MLLISGPYLKCIFVFIFRVPDNDGQLFTPHREVLVNRSVDLLQHVTQPLFKIRAADADHDLVAEGGYGAMSAQFVFQQVQYTSLENSDHLINGPHGWR